MAPNFDAVGTLAISEKDDIQDRINSLAFGMWHSLI
jgi:hypothetical protein